MPAFELLNPKETRLFSCSDGDLMPVRIGVVVPFRVLIIELDRELIVFNNSLLVESFSGPRHRTSSIKLYKSLN